MALLKVDDLKIHFPIRGGILNRKIDEVRAVDGVSFEVKEGQTYGLVGESGSGKTTTGKAVMGLNNITEGDMYFEDAHLNAKKGKKVDVRKDVQMIFQDPYSSLNPRKRVLDIVAEPFRNYEKMSKADEKEKVKELLERVGISKDSIFKYPHEFSGGQRQRIGVARAIALNPKLIIADEPVSALDVSVQAQVLNFLQDIQKDMNLTLLFIAHDLGVIKHMCDRIGIMYQGRLVEEGLKEDIFNNPQHIYTKRLVAAIPDVDPRRREEHQRFRAQVKEEYQQSFYDYFDENGMAYDLRSISDTHKVALPERG
ncbi:peptide/nickel transport system ATP-binding protein [Alkalibacillus filiformis]|uniref:Peptide/nickel transport system ATP-binding protein n=1 Tax=Alkalibacillus filiformis TaxID=200990 RepID=A0ABU0DWC3_9BACI|nr:ATP-binding cassette domain-containing protein [Alkalibacillus filiformis]MDQ0352603.1 peptide/nickel transport system ATP-binding protein [Alkalibacillus filiformis]